MFLSQYTIVLKFELLMTQHTHLLPFYAHFQIQNEQLRETNFQNYQCNLTKNLTLIKNYH